MPNFNETIASDNWTQQMSRRGKRSMDAISHSSSIEDDALSSKTNFPEGLQEAVSMK